MAHFIRQYNTNQTSGSSNIQGITDVKRMTMEVKEKVTIPMYFYNIILPQLGNYFDNYPVNFDNDPRACCPLHDEDTPSFRYYEATSSFYCFGCGRGGDIINLHMYFAEKINGTKPTREMAVAFLHQYFIKGHESDTFIDESAKTIDKKEKLNTDAEIVKFNLYRVNLEQSITHDTTLKLEIKKKLWKELDIIDNLLSKNLIIASEAEKYLKDKVKELITFDADIKKIKHKGDNNNG